MVTRRQIFFAIGVAVTFFILIQSYLYVSTPRLHPIQQARHQSSAYMMLKQFLTHCDESKAHCIMVDTWVLETLVKETFEEARSNFSPCKHLCRNHIYTFAIRDSDFDELKFNVLSKLKKAGYTIKMTTNDNKACTHLYLRYHENHSIHIVILYHQENPYRLADGWWWYGPDYDDEFGLDFTKHEGALDNFEYDFKVTIDGLEMYMPHYPKRFLEMYEKSLYVACDKRASEQFYKHYPRNESRNATEYRKNAAKVINLIKTRLDNYGIPFWLHGNTLLGWFRQCDLIPINDINVGISIKDHPEDLVPRLKGSQLALVQKIGKTNDSQYYAFNMGNFNVAINVFYDYTAGKKVWTGRTDSKTGRKYKYLFDPFTLCWTEMARNKVRIPCETKTYIEALFGPNWSSPDEKWNWRSSPPNVVRNGKWDENELDEVLQVWDSKSKRLTVELIKEEL